MRTDPEKSFAYFFEVAAYEPAGPATDFHFHSGSDPKSVRLIAAHIYRSLFCRNRIRQRARRLRLLSDQTKPRPLRAPPLQNGRIIASAPGTALLNRELPAGS